MGLLCGCNPKSIVTVTGTGDLGSASFYKVLKRGTERVLSIQVCRVTNLRSGAFGGIIFLVDPTVSIQQQLYICHLPDYKSSLSVSLTPQISPSIKKSLIAGI